MTEKEARATANTIMAAAALGAAVLVVCSTKLRRLAWKLARQYASGPLAVWAAGSVRDAWEASASAHPIASRVSIDKAGTALVPARAAADGPG
jgi:hypothetical protein